MIQPLHPPSSPLSLSLSLPHLRELQLAENLHLLLEQLRHVPLQHPAARPAGSPAAAAAAASAPAASLAWCKRRDGGAGGGGAAKVRGGAIGRTIKQLVDNIGGGLDLRGRGAREDQGGRKGKRRAGRKEGCMQMGSSPSSEWFHDSCVGTGCHACLVGGRRGGGIMQ